MKLPAFAYHRAESLADAVDRLGRYGPEARVLAGGQSLLPLMALRLAGPELLVDITTTPDLARVTVDEQSVRLGAAVTARRAETDPEVGAAHPLLVACLGEVGHVEIRTRGTVCGSVAHADPAAEMPALLLALDAVVTVAGASGSCRVSAVEFVRGPYTTALQDCELVAEVELPRLPATAGWSVRETARRHGDFALAGVITVLELDGRRRCIHPRIALFGVASTPVRATAAERILHGQVIDAALLAEAAEHAFDAVEVLGDVHGSATYRRRAGTRLVARSLSEAAGLAQEKRRD